MWLKIMSQSEKRGEGKGHNYGWVVKGTDLFSKSGGQKIASENKSVHFKIGCGAQWTYLFLDLFEPWPAQGICRAARPPQNVYLNLQVEQGKEYFVEYTQQNMVELVRVRDAKEGKAMVMGYSYIPVK